MGGAWIRIGNAKPVVSRWRSERILPSNSSAPVPRTGYSPSMARPAAESEVTCSPSNRLSVPDEVATTVATWVNGSHTATTTGPPASLCAVSARQKPMASGELGVFQSTARPSVNCKALSPVCCGGTTYREMPSKTERLHGIAEDSTDPRSTLLFSWASSNGVGPNMRSRNHSGRG